LTLTLSSDVTTPTHQPRTPLLINLSRMLKTHREICRLNKFCSQLQPMQLTTVVKFSKVWKKSQTKTLPLWNTSTTLLRVNGPVTCKMKRWISPSQC